MKMQRKTNWTLGCLVGLGLLGACNVELTEFESDGELRKTGMALTSDTLADTDVARMQYTIEGVDCTTGLPTDPAMTKTVVKDLEDMLIPGGNPDLENSPLDAGSGHLFADAFFWLPEGCYDVSVVPLQEDGSVSVDCSSASEQLVPVYDGKTTEIMLVHQCGNDAAGGLDVIAAINHAPQLVDVSYSPSKFTCDGETTICATASDPDNDPLAFLWNITGAFPATILNVEELTTPEGLLQSCATFELSAAGDYEVSVVVVDQAWSDSGQLVPIEKLLLDRGLQSRDEAVLPIHAMDDDACIYQCTCPDGFVLNPTGESCERITTTPAMDNGQFLTICNGGRNANYGALGALFPGGATLQTPFFGDGYTTFNGRLLDIGIWACDANGNYSENPKNEWIGFSHCFDLTESASYVIGLSADNVIRAKVNGQPIYELTAGNISEANHPYKYMHMIPIDLEAGANIIELEGMNFGGPAAFAAELFGPFTAAEVANDASLLVLDYENKSMWDTGTEVGNQFHTGTNSGYQCESDFALDLCGASATCTKIERVDCQ